MTLVMLLLTALSCVWVCAVYMNPQGVFNPLKPPLAGTARGQDTPVAPPGTPTEEVVFPTLPPEWTATFTPQAATETRTPRPTATERPAATATVLLSPIGPTATESETPEVTRTPTRTVRPPTATPATGGYPPGGSVSTPTPFVYP